MRVPKIIPPNFKFFIKRNKYNTGKYNGMGSVRWALSQIPISGGPSNLRLRPVSNVIVVKPSLGPRLDSQLFKRR